MTNAGYRAMFTVALIGAAAFGGFRTAQILARPVDPSSRSALTAMAADSLGKDSWRCATKPDGPKMACYRVFFVHQLAAGGVDQALAALRTLVQTDPDVKRDVHMYAHGIGIDAFQLRPDVATTFSHCTVEFSSGCYHGVMQAYFELHGTDDPMIIRGACQPYESAADKRWLLFQCLHGMGHGLNMTLNHDLPRALRGCDLLGERWHRESCYGGAFMENVAYVSMPEHPASVLAAEHGGMQMGGGGSMDMSTSSGAHPRAVPSPFRPYDRDNLLYPCTAVAERFGSECYRIQTALILYLNDGDLAGAARACAKAPLEFRPACFQSLGRDITAYADYVRPQAVHLCDLGESSMRGWCYVGVANTLIDESAKPQPGFAVCQSLTNQSYRTTCFFDVGEILVTLIPTPAEREHLCALPAARDKHDCRSGAQLDVAHGGPSATQSGARTASEWRRPGRCRRGRGRRRLRDAAERVMPTIPLNRRDIEPPASRPGTLRAWLAIVLLALVASITGIANGFAYDDRPMILQNGRLHHLVHWQRLWTETYWPPSMGAALYRPLTTSAFALEWWAGHGAPWVFHATSIGLYVLACVLVFALASLVLSRRSAWLAAALYAVHPVHVEAVANSVGQSELWAACGVVAAVALYIRWRRAAIGAMTVDQRPSGLDTATDARTNSHTRRGGALGAPWHAVVVITLVVGACLAKEHAVVAPALLLAGELLVVKDRRSWAFRYRVLRPYALALIAAVLAYVAVRTQVVGAFAGDRPNVVFEHLTPAARRWTMLGVTSEWVRLLAWPSRLSIEYAPRDIVLYDHFSVALIPDVALLAALGALTVLSVRRWPEGAFALLWLAVTLLLVSNLVVPTGVILAERTLFLPSVGAVLLAGAVLDRGMRLARAALHRSPGAAPGRIVQVSAAMIMAAVIGAAAWQSAHRQRVWRDNASVFAQAVIDAPFSYRAHDVYAGVLFGRGDRVGGEREARIALALYPHDPVLYRDLANEYMRAGLCPAAVPMLRHSIAESTMQTDARLLLAECLLTQGDAEGARDEVLRGSAEGVYGPNYHKVLLSVDSALNHRRPGRQTGAPVKAGAGAASAARAAGAGSATPGAAP